MVAKRQQYQAALDRAAAFGGVRLIAFRSRDGLYYLTRCISGEDAHHAVRVRPNGELACDCRAGRQGRPCVHAACTWLERVAAGVQFRAAPRRESAATLPPAPRSELLGVRKPLGDDSADVSAYDLLIAAGR